MTALLFLDERGAKRLRGRRSRRNRGQNLDGIMLYMSDACALTLGQGRGRFNAIISV